MRMNQQIAMSEKSDAMISEWKNAYELANGKQPPRLVYDRGWFRFDPSTGYRYRRHAVEKMIAVLRARFANQQQRKEP